MPALARKILIIAALDGLILSPITNTRSRSPPSKPVPGTVKLDYKTRAITPYLQGDVTKHSDTGEHSQIEAQGIVGLLNVSPTNSFLVAITDSKQVALIKGQHPVYVITNIALIPLSSRKDAGRSIDRANAGRKPAVTDGNASDTETEIDSEEDPITPVTSITDDVRSKIDEAGRAADMSRSTSIGEDVIGKKGAYGRFTEKWFSKRGWTADRRRASGMSTISADGDKKPDDNLQKKPENQPAPPTTEGDIVQGERAEDAVEDSDKGPVEQKSEEVAESVKETVTHSLTPKLLHTTKLILAQSRSFYFSYDWDITRSWAQQMSQTEEEKAASASTPLHKKVDPLFFWNKHLQKAFIDSDSHGFVLPLMQGFVAQTTFSATTSTEDKDSDTVPAISAAGDAAAAASPEGTEATATNEPVPEPPVRTSTDSLAPSSKQDLILTLISRRSTKRAGLRYLRRGIDDSGHVANSVETEQLLATDSWDRCFSYLQIRGSIPLFFSQSPYSLRPRPVLLLSDEHNAAALAQHFANLHERYGKVHIVNLVEDHGSEAVVGDKYRDFVASYNDRVGADNKVGWTWFDFHRECRGMRFENVSRLFSTIGPELDQISFTFTLGKENPEIKQHQAGVLRTNCMDCLDRTNVVQSGSARRALESQLKLLNVSLPPGGTTFFNLLWADNGDAISKQYASTAALKGDFTRTNKRNLQGALTDFTLTVTRYFTNIISDFFTQAAIDFLLGNVTSQVFVDFEAEMRTSDPSVSLRRVRENAIDVSRKIVVADENEQLLGGWTFLSPHEPGEVKGQMTEKVLLVTEKALYMCAFDFSLEKVVAFERVAVEAVKQIRWGAYITETFAQSQLDEQRNCGVVVAYEKREEGRERRWAFKAMPAGNGVEQGKVEREVVREAVEVIKGVCQRAEVKEEDVVGAEEAKRETGLVQRWGYAVKRLVWA
ncbi:SacI homology domain-containing protein [Pyronema domesticum]|nr:SacI homology domain-containing protein [Pyronema domesticum]